MEVFNEKMLWWASILGFDPRTPCYCLCAALLLYASVRFLLLGGGEKAKPVSSEAEIEAARKARMDKYLNMNDEAEQETVEGEAVEGETVEGETELQRARREAKEEQRRRIEERAAFAIRRTKTFD